MSKKHLVIYASLLVCLFIYLFYRTDRTLVNGIVIGLISPERFTAIKTHIANAIPLGKTVIYSLPEGLWVLCITLTSKPYYLRLFGRRIYCIFAPLIFGFTLEILQLFHITNGRFDFMDLAATFIFWLPGCILFSSPSEKQNIFGRPDAGSVFCLCSYSIVFLAHVFK